MIKIIDYGMGNLRSVQKALERVGAQAVICSRVSELADAEKLILPGVGAFRDAIHELRRQGMDGPIREHIAAGKPFLGVCLGLQLLFDVSCEDGQYEGLGIVPGEVVRFRERPGLKIPHMGWNSLDVVRRPNVLAGIPDGASFYFVHSYHVVPREESVIACTTDHGGPFVSVIARDNVLATQFHPEKSQRAGLKLLENFAAL